MLTDFYRKYLCSLDWAVQRQRALDRAGNKCERCGVSGEIRTLDVHHLTYARLGCEWPTDLKVVCVDCHKIEDREREARNESKFYDARLDGWASKKFGEDWADRLDYEQVVEKFESWLDRKAES